MKKKLLNFIFYSCTFLLVISLVSLGFSLGIIYMDYHPINLENLPTDYTDCSSLNLPETTNCLRDYVSTVFNYTERSDIDRPIEDVIKNGGDCFDWNKNVYNKLFTNLGFHTEEVHIFSDFDSPTPGGHVLLVVYDKDLTGYCTVDMLNIQCLNFEE